MLSELIMNGRMDLAVLYGNRDVHGLNILPLLEEELFLVSNTPDTGPVPLASLQEVWLFLPWPYNIVHKLVDEHFLRAGMTARVVAEMEFAMTLKAAVAEELGATILPASMAHEMADGERLHCRRIVDRVIQAPLTLCESDHLPLPEPALAVKATPMELTANPSWIPESGDPGAP